MKEGPQLLQIASTTKQYLIWNFSGTFNYTAVKRCMEKKQKKTKKTYDEFLTYRQ